MKLMGGMSQITKLSSKNKKICSMNHTVINGKQPKSQRKQPWIQSSGSQQKTINSWWQEQIQLWSEGGWYHIYLYFYLFFNFLKSQISFFMVFCYEYKRIFHLENLLILTEAQPTISHFEGFIFYELVINLTQLILFRDCLQIFTTFEWAFFPFLFFSYGLVLG